ncbi:MAG: DUF502 domain-containing protein [Waddliaceae bacterium]|nr:DUF502 domain-containing protein [Waddliaceae bacterium]MBT3578815.1 DUF502 domain-containing protein [Waddliaceae bacterium]MBT4445606.1 DUF502 domain-containing protein [Waddliaceae bacterium]MBT6928780.1 DUF502 domain-containing protein [Waddliaceae bacterium]MBT7263861.1 DUF502 domain-containing protein [Waddliaceae bacterium]
MKKHLGTGLVILCPLIITALVMNFLINLLTKPFTGFVKDFFIEHGLQNISFYFLGGKQIVHITSQVLIIISLIVGTIFLGIIARWFFIKSLIRFGDKFLHKIPFINKLYKTSQDIVKTVASSDFKSFEQVVMVPYPNEKTFCIGFITRKAPAVCNNSVGNPLMAVFIPTTPNPTSGFLLMYREEEIIFLDMSIEDGIKFIISCGVIHPEINVQ